VGDGTKTEGTRDDSFLDWFGVSFHFVSFLHVSFSF